MIAAASVPARTDEELLLAYSQTQDGAAFEALVRRYEPELFGYLRRYLRSPEMAADVFQTTFLQVHLKCATFVPGKAFRPWLYAIATHQAIDAQRRNRRHRLVELDRPNTDGRAFVSALADRGGPADEQAEAAELRRVVRAAVNGLSHPHRLVVELVYHQGLKYREAAGRIGVPVGTVKSRVRAALAKLAASWRHDARFA